MGLVLRAWLNLNLSDCSPAGSLLAMNRVAAILCIFVGSIFAAFGFVVLFTKITSLEPRGLLIAAAFHGGGIHVLPLRWSAVAASAPGRLIAKRTKMLPDLSQPRKQS